MVGEDEADNMIDKARAHPRELFARQAEIRAGAIEELVDLLDNGALLSIGEGGGTVVGVAQQAEQGRTHMLTLTTDQPGATTLEFATIFEAVFRIFDLAVEHGPGCLVTDSHSGRTFRVQHVADRVPHTTEHAPVESHPATA